MNKYTILLNNYGDTLEVEANSFEIQDNVIRFLKNKGGLVKTVALFTLNNIIGFYKVVNKED